MRECFFCGETNEVVLQEHHIVPKSMNTSERETITLCANCHRKVHYIINPLTKYANIEWKFKDSLDSKEVEDVLEKVRQENMARAKILNYLKENPKVQREKLFADLGAIINGVETKRLLAELVKDGKIYLPESNCFALVG